MRITLITMLLLAAPRVALACPVCFGQNDSPMSSGAKMAVIFMLVIVGVVLSAFASFFIYLMRRARMAADEAGAAASAERSREPVPSAGQGEAGHHVRAEGTASC
jgi:hypothetical protein